MNGSLYSIDSFIHLYFGKFHNQNGILSSQTNKRHQSDLEIDIILQSRYPNTQISPQRCNRQRKQHRNRHNPAFILSCKKQEYKEEHQSQNHTSLSAGLLFLIRKATPFKSDIFRQMLLHNTLHRCHRITRTIPRCGNSINRSRREHIETFDCTRTGSIFRCTQCRKRNHRTVLGPYEEKPQALFVRTVRCFGLNIHTIDTVEHIKIVHIDRT